ncbi:hypothetical protein IFM89_000197 [Coptis chinensis]|uniref:Uncharacterized protein n=1 Tax=Coptis chinensis TaxID=261450 RepID=A0A835I8C4_9MAGN|nr:hypothetical protein IFM89_000197 [Coptis chinensis]
MGWGNNCKRRVKVFTLALVIYFDYKVLQQREKWISKSKRASLWGKARERNAKRLLNLVCRTIQKEFGKSMDELFSDFVKTPIATASSIVDWIAWAEPQYDFNPMIDEWCKEAPKELDFNHEAENTRTVSKNLSCKSNPENDVDILIPEVIQSTEKVLFLEYMDGIRLNDCESLEAYAVDKQKVVEEITRAYAHQIYVDGFFNGDPHPGNFLVSKEPPHRPILLDFGLTKLISSSMKQALAKMFLASAEGDYVALLSAFAEMGLKLCLDLPEQAMMENMKSLTEERTKNIKVIQEKLNMSKKEVPRFNPVDAFPGDAVIFVRVLNLLQGLPSTLNVRVIYLDIMRPFAESILQGNISKVPASNEQWISTPVQSNVEAKLRELLIELGGDDRILGVQVCAYKDGKVVIDTAAGVLGRYDPRPIQPDSLFPVFSAIKGITAGMLHWLDMCVHLTLVNFIQVDIKHASGKKFQEVVNEAIIHPLNIEGELYIGIPPGIILTLVFAADNVSADRVTLHLPAWSDIPGQMVSSLVILFNSLNIRRAIIPAANGHCSARALARYYATLAAGGIIPPPHTHSEPALGSHPHIPNFPSLQPKEKGSKSKEVTVTKDKTKSKNNDPSESKDSKSNTYSKKDGNRNYMQLPADVTNSR